MRNKFALHMFHVQLPTDFVDKINNYVDEKLIPLDDNYGKVKGILNYEVMGTLVLHEMRHEFYRTG